MNGYQAKPVASRAIVHSSNPVITVYYQQTLIESEDEVLKEKFKDGMFKAKATYSFKSSQCVLSLQALYGAPEIVSHNITSGTKSKFNSNKDGYSITVDLSSRHALDKNFYMSLKYFLSDYCGYVKFDSKFHFKVTKS